MFSKIDGIPGHFFLELFRGLPFIVLGPSPLTPRRQQGCEERGPAAEHSAIRGPPLHILGECCFKQQAVFVLGEGAALGRPRGWEQGHPGRSTITPNDTLLIV